MRIKYLILFLFSLSILFADDVDWNVFDNGGGIRIISSSDTIWASIGQRYIGYGYTDSTEIHAGYYYTDKDSSILFRIYQSWNLISHPFSKAITLSELFPFAYPPAYRYNPIDRVYEEAETLFNSKGYWILSPLDTMITYSSHVENSLTYRVFRSWNMIGTPATIVSAENILSNPAIIPPVYGYNPLTKSYFEADILYPGIGYWILSSEEFDLNIP